MSAIKALRLDNPDVKNVMQHRLLKGKKPIARGVFSAIFEGTQKNTVLKMTVDDVSYWMLNDVYSHVTHRHFPKALVNHQDIGKTNVNGEILPIYLYEMEKLEKLDRVSDNRRLAREICNGEDRASHQVMTVWTDPMHSVNVLAGMIQDNSLPRGIRNALSQLSDFCRLVPGGTLDMHIGNFMQRKNGELVITDPLANMVIQQAAVKQLQQRGW